MSAPRPMDFSMPDGLSGANRYGKAPAPKPQLPKKKLELNEGELRVKIRVDGASPRELAIPEDSALAELYFRIWEFAGETVSFKVLHNAHIISQVDSIDSASGESESKLLSDFGVQAGSSLMVLCTTNETIRSLHEADASVGKFDGRRDFAQEEELARQRAKAAPMYIRKAQGSLHDNGWGFSRIEPLNHDPETGLPYTSPSPQEAQKLLESLAHDKGIEAIMKKYSWRVGLLTEIAPGLRTGLMGESQQCLLGLNVGMGEEIKLRLRTSDLKSFRPYLAIKQTLIHELTHNVHNDHPPEFWKLFRELMKEAEVLDWTKSKGQSLSDEPVSHYHYQDMEKHSCSHHGHSLGGNLTAEESGLSERELALIAAEQRLLNSQPAKEKVATGAKSPATKATGNPPASVQQPSRNDTDLPSVSSLDPASTAVTSSDAQVNGSATESPSKPPPSASTSPAASSTQETTKPITKTPDSSFVTADENHNSNRNHGLAGQASASVEQLVSMGFGADQAEKALERFKGSVERAADWLFNQPSTGLADRSSQKPSEQSGAEPLGSQPHSSQQRAIPETEEQQQLKSRMENGVQRFVSGVAPNWQEARTGLHTLSTMLGNILKSPEEPKFRKIRLTNGAYMNKIGKFEGGKEMLLAANFRYVTVSITNPSRTSVNTEVHGVQLVFLLAYDPCSENRNLFRFSSDGEALQYDRQDPADLVIARQVLDSAVDSLP